MNLIKLQKTLLPILIGSLLFSCTKKTRDDCVANNAEIKAFVSYFFVPNSTLQKKQVEVFSLREQAAQSLQSDDDVCSSDYPCNRTKEYFLAFTPNFFIESMNGQSIIMEAEPDAFVDVCDIREKKVYRVRQTGTEGSIYGTIWLSDFSFVVYGFESDEVFVEVYEIKAKTIISYAIDKSKRKSDANLNAFLVAKYGQAENPHTQH